MKAQDFRPAFSLFEMVVVMILFSAIAVLISKPINELTRINIRGQKNANDLIDMELALLSLEKIISKCVDLKITKSTVQCYLQKRPINKEDKSFKITYSGLILKNKDAKIYSPANSFKNIYAFKNKELFYLEFQDERLLFAKKISLSKGAKRMNKKLLPLNDLNILLGPFTPLDGMMNLYFKDRGLFYDFYDFSSLKSFMFLNELDLFEAKIENNFLIFKLCKKTLCLEKIIKIL